MFPELGKCYDYGNCGGSLIYWKWVLSASFDRQTQVCPDNGHGLIKMEKPCRLKDSMATINNNFWFWNVVQACRSICISIFLSYVSSYTTVEIQHKNLYEEIRLSLKPENTIEFLILRIAFLVFVTLSMLLVKVLCRLMTI